MDVPAFRRRRPRPRRRAGASRWEAGPRRQPARPRRSDGSDVRHPPRHPRGVRDGPDRNAHAGGYGRGAPRAGSRAGNAGRRSGGPTRGGCTTRTAARPPTSGRRSTCRGRPSAGSRTACRTRRRRDGCGEAVTAGAAHSTRAAGADRADSPVAAAANLDEGTEGRGGEATASVEAQTAPERPHAGQHGNERCGAEVLLQPVAEGADDTDAGPGVAEPRVKGVHAQDQAGHRGDGDRPRPLDEAPR